MKPKHTPGPWRVDFTNAKCSVNAATHNIANLKASWMVWDKRGWNEARANARLMSVSPEMFALLGEALTALKNGCETPEDRDGLVAAIEAALRKAGGNEQ